MKLFILLFVSLTGISASSQVNQIPGKYTLRSVHLNEVIIEYNLTLNQDGTFHFHAYTNLKERVPNEDNKYGKGRWTEESKKKFSTEYIEVAFSTDPKNDFDEKYTLDFTDTRARLMLKSPRDNSTDVVQPKLRIFKSEIFWLDKVDLLREL